MAEKFLARAFSCPMPEADQPAKITSAGFSGNGTRFRIILDATILLDTDGLYPGRSTGKIEARFFDYVVGKVEASKTSAKMPQADVGFHGNGQCAVEEVWYRRRSEPLQRSAFLSRPGKNVRRPSL